MKKIIVNAGDRYGMLTIIKFHHEKTLYYPRKDASYRKTRLGKRTYRYYECQCDCGNTCVVELTHLRTGHTQSCGCFREWKMNQPRNVNTHKLSSHPLYGTWCKMRARCNSQKDGNYKNYGGRGIKVCDEWNASPLPFISWAESHGWYDGCGLTLDRIDCNGDYSPDNCRWANCKTQSNNKRTNHYITYKGETHTTAEWAEIIGISLSGLHKRLKNNWSLEDALTKPANPRWSTKGVDDYNINEVHAKEMLDYKNKVMELKQITNEVQPRPDITLDTIIEFNSINHTVQEWADFMNIKPYMLLRRLKLGWDMQDALLLSPRRRSEGTN